MARFHIDDFRSLEITPTSPGSLRSKVAEVIMSSISTRARVESINPDTGQYRIILQGRLDPETGGSRRW